MTTKTALHRPLAGVLLVLALVAAACGGAPSPASPTSSGSPRPGQGNATPSPAAEPTPVPGTTGDPGSGLGGGGGTDPGTGGASEPGSPGTGGGGSVPADPGNGGGPGNPAPTMVTPVAGATGVHPIQATDLQVAVSGRDVTARIAWWSGVEPCNVLAGVQVTRDGWTITLTVNEGSAGGTDVMCIEIAVFKATLVDLGALEPGTWTIRATGQAAPVEVTIGA